MPLIKIDGERFGHYAIGSLSEGTSPEHVYFQQQRRGANYRYEQQQYDIFIALCTTGQEAIWLAKMLNKAGELPPTLR